MTTCLRIISGAMKKLQVLAMGREPTAAQGEDGLLILQSMYHEFVGQGVFGRLIPSLITASDYEAHEGERVICDRTVTTVTLPTVITLEWYPGGGPIGAPYDYGWSYSGSATYPRSPRDNAVLQISDTNDAENTETWIYDATRAEWVKLEGLVVSSRAPLSGRYDEALKAILAVKMASSYGIEPSPTLQRAENTGKYMLSTRFDRASSASVGNYV